jgi:hypothetical protein
MQDGTVACAEHRDSTVESRIIHDFLHKGKSLRATLIPIPCPAKNSSRLKLIFFLECALHDRLQGNHRLLD